MLWPIPENGHFGLFLRSVLFEGVFNTKIYYTTETNISFSYKMGKIAIRVKNMFVKNAMTVQ